MGEVVEFKNEFLALKKACAEPTCDEIAEEFLEKFDEPKNRIEQVAVDVSNYWQELLHSGVSKIFFVEFRKRLERLEDEKFNDTPEAS